MFWRVSGFTQPSAVETALDQANCTLEDLLREDELIQEVKSLNSRVLEFLMKPENVQGLVRYLVAPPPPDADQSQTLRLPYAACEVLCCEVDGILSTLLADEASMELLFSLLQQSPPLECVTAGYFARVVGMLLFRRTGDVMEFLKARQHLLTRLVVHLDTASIFEILVRLVGAEEQTGMYLPPSQVQWLTGTDVMRQLLSVLEPGHGDDAARHAAEVLAAVARSQLSPLGRAMAEPEFLQTLLQRAFQEDGPSSVQALDVCIALLEPRSLDGPPPASPTSSVASASSGRGEALQRMSVESVRNLQSAAIAGIAAHAGRLKSMLDDSVAPPEQETAYGVLSPPLGTNRLKAVEMVAALSRLGAQPAEAALIEAELLPRCMALFLQYPFNNLLHHQVTAALMGALNTGSPEMLSHAFGAAGLLPWLLGAPDAVRPAARPGDARAADRPALRAGYMGYVTYMANKLQEAAERSDYVNSQLEADSAWKEYVSGPLQARNAVENVNKWACGRPPPSELAAAAAEAAADEAGLMDLDPGPEVSGLDLPTSTAAGLGPVADGEAAARRYFDATGEEEDDPVFRDASDALDALRLSPHLTTKIPQGAAAGGSDSSDDDGSDGSSGSSGDGSPPPAPRSSGASAAEALSCSLDAEAGADRGELVVSSDEEELLLEDDAVVVGMPDTNGPLPPPPAEEAKVPHIVVETPEGLDPQKPTSAAVPPAVPPPTAAAAHSAPVSIPTAAAAGGGSSSTDAEDAEEDEEAVLIGSGPGRPHGSLLGASAWLRAGGGGGGNANSTGRKSPPEVKVETAVDGAAPSAGSPSASNPHRAPRSAFASWRPTWQAVEDQSAKAAASAAADYANAVRAGSSSPPDGASPVLQDRSAAEAAEAGQAETQTGSQGGGNNAQPEAAVQAAEALLATEPVQPAAEGAAPAGGSDSSPDASQPVATGHEAPAQTPAATQPSGANHGSSVPVRERHPDGRPKFNWAGVKSTFADTQPSAAASN